MVIGTRKAPHWVAKIASAAAPSSMLAEESGIDCRISSNVRETSSSARASKAGSYRHRRARTRGGRSRFLAGSAASHHSSDCAVILTEIATELVGFGRIRRSRSTNDDAAALPVCPTYRRSAASARGAGRRPATRRRLSAATSSWAVAAHRTSDSEHAHVLEGGGKPGQVVWVTGCNDRGRKLCGRRDDKRVDGMGR